MVRKDSLQKTNVQHGCDTILVAADEYSLIVHSEHAPKNCPKSVTGSTCNVPSGQKHQKCVGSSLKSASRVCKLRSNTALVPPTSIKQSLLTNLEAEDRVKFSILSSDQYQKCLTVNSKDVLPVGGNDVTCVGCRKGIETLLDSMKSFPLACFNCFEFIGGGKIKMNPGSLKYSDCLYRNLAISKYRIKEICDSLPRRNKSRCIYHSVNHDMGGAKESAVQWKVLWDNTSPECRKDILKISYDELKNSHEVYVKKHRFCEDCQDHLTHAFRLLFYLEDYTEFEDFDPEIYDCLTVEQCSATGEKYICVPADLDVLAEMMDRLKNQLDTNNPNEERHARSLDVAQKEIVLCIAMFIYKRIQSIVMRFSAFITCVELLPHLIWLTFRKNLEEAVEDIEGQIRIEKTLREIALVDAKLEAQKERKREKKRNRKNRLKTVNTNRLQELETESQENFQLEMFFSGSKSNSESIINPKSETCLARKRTASDKMKSRGCSISPSANGSDGGYSTGESASRYSCDAANDILGNCSTRRKANKSSSSSSALSVNSTTSPSNQSTSPVSTKSSSPVKTPVNNGEDVRKKERIRANKKQTKILSDNKCTKHNQINSKATVQKGQLQNGTNYSDLSRIKKVSKKALSNDKLETPKKEANIGDNSQSSKTKVKAFNKQQTLCLLDYEQSEVTTKQKTVVGSKQQSETKITCENQNDGKVSTSGKSIPDKRSQNNSEAPLGNCSNFLTADEIAEFKKQHGDYLKNRDVIRAKIKTQFEHKLKVGGLVC